jgi:CheY-like chemotaxis protein
MESTAKRQVRVLVVDDDHDVADSSAELLRLLDYDVRAAYSGEEAIGVAGRYRPDIVILDINMPGLDGWETARRLKRDRRLANKCFIAHTARGEPLVRRIASKIGFDGLVVKGQPLSAALAH